MKRSEYNLSAYVIPSEDAHQSEYIAECDMRRGFISGFDGSAGLAVVKLDRGDGSKVDKVTGQGAGAVLATDGRYFLQASQQLNEQWTLLKQGEQKVPTWQEWLVKNVTHGRVGIDPTLITASDARLLEKNLKEVGTELVSIEKNLVDMIWESPESPVERPKKPAGPVILVLEQTTGRSYESKVKALRSELENRQVKGMVVNMLDEVAWLFNCRGSDIPYNPVFFAFALVTASKATLYTDNGQLSPKIKEYLEQQKVSVKPYPPIYEEVRVLGQGLKKSENLFISNKGSLALVQALGGFDAVTIQRSPIQDAKAIKNQTEMDGFRECHKRDGAALVQYFAWLEEELDQGRKIDEVEGADKLESYRRSKEMFKGLSFSTCSASGANAAIIHYSPVRGECATIEKDKIYLCDSGAQYLDGTTDTTRTVCFGTPTAAPKRSFTRVLQGHIAIDTIIIPKGTTGYVIDAIARKALWSDGLDYRHGTGHGVGSFLNVHEGPQGIGTRVAFNDVAIQAGMCISNGGWA